LRCYANGWYRGTRTPEGCHEKAREVIRRGYTALKFDPFGAAWRTVDRRKFDLSVEIIAAVRDAVGPGVGIMVEGHNRFSAHTALQLAEGMAPLPTSMVRDAGPAAPHLRHGRDREAEPCVHRLQRELLPFGTIRRAPQARRGAHRLA
jgi:galactonate dehydratase